MPYACDWSSGRLHICITSHEHHDDERSMRSWSDSVWIQIKSIMMRRFHADPDPCIVLCHAYSTISVCVCVCECVHNVPSLVFRFVCVSRVPTNSSSSVSRVPTNSSNGVSRVPTNPSVTHSNGRTFYAPCDSRCSSFATCDSCIDAWSQV